MLVGEGARDGRPLHRKALLGVRGRFEVGEVPPEWRHGPFVDVAASARRGQPALLGVLLRHLGFLGLLRALPRLQRSLDSSRQSLAERTYFTAVPLRLGPHAVKLRFRPVDVPPPVAPTSGGDALGAELRARVEAAPLAFRVEAQRFVDEGRTPIEDPTVEWPESARARPPRR